MALTVGELVAYIRADGKQFDQQVDQSGQKFSGLGRLVAAGTKTLATGFVALTTGAAAVGAAVFKVGADYNRLQQSSRAALATLLGSAEAANAQMDKLDEFARNSPFAKQVFITAQQQLLGFGVQAEKVLPILDAVQNAVAAVGGSNEQVSQVTYALSQMQGQGKLTGETLNQLGQYGIDAAGILGKALGKTGAEIRELASKPGGIPVDQVWDPLVAGLMERFGGATANIKLQLDGAIDRVKGATRDIGSILAAPFIDPNGGGRAVEWANKLADALRAAEAKAKPFVDLLVARYQPALDAVTPALDRARGAVNNLDLSKLNAGLDRASKYAPLIAGTSAALFALGTSNIPILSTLGISLNPVVAGMAALVATSPQLRAAGGDFLSSLAPLVPVAALLARTVSDVAMEMLRALTPAVRDVLLAASDLALRLATDLTPTLLDVIKAGVPLAEILGEVVSWISEIPTPVLVAVAAFVALAQVREPLESAFETARGVVGAFSETMQASQATAQALGRDVGVVGTTAIAARAGVSALSSALKTAFISNAVGIAITGITAAIAAFIGQQAAAKQRVDDFKDSLDEATGAITENTKAVAFNNLEQDGTIAKARELGISLKDLLDAAIDPTSDGYQRLAERGRQANAELKAVTDGQPGNAKAIKGVADANENLWGVLNAVGLQQDTVAASQEQWRWEQEAGLHTTGELAESVGGLNEKLRDNVQAQKDAAGVAISLREAQIAQTESQNAAAQAAANGAVVTRDAAGAIDLNAESTIAADKALLDLASRNAQVTEAMTKQNASSQELYASTVAQRDAFINAATSMGYTRDEAAKLAAQYGLIPQKVTTTVVAQTTEADGAVRTIVDRLNNIDGKTFRAIVRVDTQGNTTVTTGIGNNVARANGAFTPGPGSRVRAAADGLFSGRDAQFAPAGSWITWAEDETGGETYIPHAMSKRRNATKFLDATAREFGYFLVPANAQARADGGTTAPAALAAPTEVSLAGATVVLRVGDQEMRGYVESVASPVANRAVRLAGGRSR